MRRICSYCPLVAMVVMLVAGCTSIMQRNWKNAKSTNTIVAYEQFLKQYSEGRLAHKARTRIEELYLQKAKDANSIEAYEEFLRLYPLGKLSDEALVKLGMLYLEKTETKNPEQLLKRYPQDRLTHMACVGIEAMYLERAKDNNTIEAYEEFLRQYPNGKLSDKALTKLKVFYFEEAKKINTIEAYEEFLRLYPHCEFSNEARTKLDTLYLRRHKDSIVADEQFVAKCSDSQLVVDARPSINELRFSRIEVVLFIRNLYHVDNNEEREEKNTEIDETMKKYVENFLLPQLIIQGFTVKYLGVRVLPQQTGQKAMLTIDYAETVGGLYGLFARNDFRGLNISCILRLIHPVTGEMIWEDRLIAGNSISVSGFGNPHKNALENLESKFAQININLDKWVRR